MVMTLNPTPSVPALPRLKDKTKTDVRYVLISPYASAHIYWDDKINELVYDVEEPILQEHEKNALIKLESAIQEIVNINVSVENSVEATAAYIDKTARLLLDELNVKMSEETYKKIFYYLYRDFIGLNEIEPIIRDYYIEDIECNGVDTPVYVVHRIYRNLKTNVKFVNPEHAASFVEKLAQRTGRYVSYAQPLLDGSLPDGSRVNATYTKDVTSRGPTFTIRKFTNVPWTPIQLLSFNTVSPEMLAYFWILLQYKSNILIAGGTASGKTTFLNALAFFIPPEARVVSLEDTREINLPRENWLPAVARTSVGAGKVGEVDLFDILKNSFRQNPDYLIVGEVRGKEAFVLFQGMASGHASISTMHADSVDTLIRRLQTPPIELSPTLVNSLDCVVIATHATVRNQQTRRIREVAEIVKVNLDGTAVINTPLIWEPAQDLFFFKKQSRIFDKISLRNGIPIEKLYREFSIRANILYEMYKRKIFGFVEVQKVINDYYKKPEEVIREYNLVKTAK